MTIANISTNTNTTMSNMRTFSHISGVVILCLSSRGGISLRAAARRSWAYTHENVVFVIGDEDCSIPPSFRTTPYSCEQKSKPSHLESEKWALEMDKINENVQRELQTHSDVIVLPMVDYYRSLAQKLKLAYQWALKNTNANWFLKIDDDSVVRIHMMEFELRIFDPKQLHVFGFVRKNVHVPRTGKWQDPEYKKSVYPTFVNGAQGHIVSRCVASKIVSYDGFEYQGEDVSLGIWIDEIKLNVEWHHSPQTFTNKGDCHDKSKSMIGHNISPDKMMKCFPNQSY